MSERRQAVCNTVFDLTGLRIVPEICLLKINASPLDQLTGFDPKFSQLNYIAAADFLYWSLQTLAKQNDFQSSTNFGKLVLPLQKAEQLLF